MGGLNSGLFQGAVTHHRREPVEHFFIYPYLAFFLDLDELAQLNQKFKYFSWNRWNLFSFWNKDHIEKPTVLQYIESKGVHIEGCKIFLLTQLRLLGYVFNPVSFYYCFDPHGTLICVVPEVNNTFKEMKFFFLGKETSNGKTFSQRQVKNFYVSPFIDLEDLFEFHIQLPTEQMNISINTYKPDATTPFLKTRLTGKRCEISDWHLLRVSIVYPFITFRVIFAIHWQAFRLFLKGVPFFKKDENPHLQTEVYRAPSKFKKTKA